MTAAAPWRPGSLAVEVTTRCHRRCSYCYNAWKADDGYPRGELGGDELVAVVDRALDEAGLDRVQVTGGEPLLREDLFDILGALRRRGRKVSLVTDGGLVDEAAAARLAALGVAPVQVTLLAGRRELHDELKGSPGFDATLRAIGRLRRAGVPVSVAFVCTRRNHGELRGVIELCFALGAPVVAFSRFCAAGEGAAHAAELTPTPDQLRGCLDVAERANARLGMKVRVAISLPSCSYDRARYPHLAFGRCAMTSERPGVTIDPLGRLRACSTSPTILGDLRAESLGAILQRARRGALAEVAVPPEACRRCDELASCGGGCRVSAQGRFGDLSRPDPLALPA